MARPRWQCCAGCHKEIARGDEFAMYMSHGITRKWHDVPDVPAKDCWGAKIREEEAKWVWQNQRSRPAPTGRLPVPYSRSR